MPDIAGTTAVDAPTSWLVAWIELNKAALRHGLPLAWSGQLPAAVRQQLVHLVPARDQPDWRRRWSYGMLGWRKGPDFAYVVDSRSGVRESTLALPVLAGLLRTRPRPASLRGGCGPGDARRAHRGRPGARGR